MTSQPKGSNWQLSLANILVFVFAVGVWMVLVRQGAILERQWITFGAMIVAGFCAVVAYRQRRRAVMLLITVFLFVVAGSHSGLRYQHLKDMELRERRMMDLMNLEAMVLSYSSLVGMPPPPSTNIATSGSDLYRALITPVMSSNGVMVGPVSSCYFVRVENGVSHITNSFNSRLLWAKTSDGKWILVDTGPDNLPGGTLGSDGVYTPGPIDANGDGKNDGADDLAVFPTFR